MCDKEQFEKVCEGLSACLGVLRENECPYFDDPECKKISKLMPSP